MIAPRVVAAILLAPACFMTGACDDSTPAPVAQVATPDPADRGATFAQDSMRDWFIETSVATIPETEEEIAGMLGVPDSVVRIPTASAQDPMAYDTIIEAFYPGMSMTLLKIGADETLQNLWVGDSTFVAGPIRIGTDTTMIRALLGPPLPIGGKPGYVCGMCSIARQSVQFDLVDGKVTGMLFTFPGR